MYGMYGGEGEYTQVKIIICHPLISPVDLH